MTLHHGDCLDVMAAMEPESVDAIVTDPPYGLEFMGKKWDKLSAVGTLDPRALGTPFARRANQPRWSSKSTGVRGADEQRRHGVAAGAWHQRWAEAAYRVAKPSAYLLAFGGTRTVHRMTVAIEDAGWIIRDMLVWAYASGFPKSKASLKPAWEPIVMARKPGPLRELAIDACRIPGATEATRFDPDKHSHDGYRMDATGADVAEANGGLGRWPANVILTDPIFDGGWDGVVGGGEANRWFSAPRDGDGKSRDGTSFTEHVGDGIGYGDSGTYSRFFLVPKSDRADREPVVGIGGEAKSGGRVNVHPTQAVKPTELMRHLVRLVTPTGGTVLDPFAGSGSTLLAAEMEGFAWIGIEKEAEYVAIAEARLNGTQRGLGLPA